MKIYNEYQNIYVNQINEYIRQGYEPIHFYVESHSAVESQNMQGNFMGNSISLSVPINRIYNNNMVVMGRATAAKLLYEKGLKGENNT